jgi:hypothetical protein
MDILGNVFEGCRYLGGTVVRALVNVAALVDAVIGALVRAALLFLLLEAVVKTKSIQQLPKGESMPLNTW